MNVSTLALTAQLAAEWMPGYPMQREIISLGPVPDLVPLVAHQPPGFHVLVVETDRVGGEIRSCSAGSPICVVLLVVERVTGTVSTLQVVLLFFAGGVCGVLGASLLEANLRSNLGLFIAVGFIEEFVKGLVLVIGTRGARPRTPLQGALLGASVGAGFAAFESAGYAFNAAITAQGVDLLSLLETEAIRAILTPIGHVTWTAILGAVLFGVAGSGRRPRAALLVLVAFVGVAMLRAFWDSLGGITQFAALVLSGNTLVVLEYGAPPPRAVDAVITLSTVLYVVGIVIVGALGALALWLVLRKRKPADAMRPARRETTPRFQNSTVSDHE